ncbi:ATP-binding protein [Streptomyces spongiae]|uniref:ATP-binding protein n=1 Tax=Streptomyces spongiae TaxID=565072 RepID=UPI001D141A8E|nr:hypothetical protein [Streptomyces spongiae]
MGETRLALETATGSSKAFPNGVRLVDLASAHDDPTVVAATVANVLGIPDCGPGEVLAQLVARLASHHALLVLDNCEHVVGACAELARTLLSAAPDMRIPATSRQALDVTEVVKLCAALDGVSLAIELAASRLRTLTVGQALERLRDRFALLSRGDRTAGPRQRTLRALVDWSYELSTPAERILWSRLSVFAGLFALDAAEEVCAGEGITKDEVMDLLDRLVGQSIVLTTEREGLPRYRLLTTIRAYGRDRLTESGEEYTLLRRHRDFFLGLAEHIADGWFGPGQAEALARLRLEHDDLRLALEYGGPTGTPAPSPGQKRSDDRTAVPAETLPSPADAQSALALATALRFHWCADRYLGEGRRQFDRLLAAAPEPTPGRARALWAAAWVALLQSDLDTAELWLDEAEQLGEYLDDAVVRAYVEGFRGSSAQFRGQVERAIHHFESALAAHKVADDEAAAPFWLFQLSLCQSLLGDPRALQTGAHGLALTEARVSGGAGPTCCGRWARPPGDGVTGTRVWRCCGRGWEFNGLSTTTPAPG